jgi:heterogeneous nuclear rnp K-like protein 2
MASKRALDDTETVDEGIKIIKTDGEVAPTDEMMEIRVLIDNYEASVIIGKGGSNVKNIRAESSAFVSILKNDSPVSKERVLTVKGSEESIAAATKLIAVLLLDAGNQRKQTDPKAPEPETEYGMKFLIHKFLAGAIIGKGGCIIREIQESAGVRISLSVDPLGNSTEKTVTVTGTPDTLHAGVVRVLSQLANNPLRTGSTTILYVPGAGVPPAAFGAPFNPYGAPPSPYGAPPSPYGAPPQSPYGAPYGAAPPAAQGPTKTEKIVIPTVCAGTVIGKSGTIIRDIKNQSGTNITIADPEPTAPADRVVSVTGTHQGIQIAIHLIRQRVESYQPPNVAAPALY